MTEKERRQQRSAFLTEKNTKRDETKSLLTREEKERRKKRSSFLEVDKTVSASPTSNHTPTPSRPVNMREDEAMRTLAKQMQSAPDTKQTAILDDYIRSKQTGTQGAATVLRHKENQQAAAYQKEAAGYFEEQAVKKAATEHIPVAADKYSMMSDEELKADFDSTGNEFASAEITKRYKDRFYSMSDEERKLVAQINAFDEGYSKDGGARMNAAAELKNKYNYTNDDITAMVYFYNRYANKEKARQEDIDARVAMDQHPFLESLASIPKGVAGGFMEAVGIADSALDNKGVEKIGIEDQGLDYNNEFSRLKRQAQSGRAEFTDTHDLMIGDYDVGDLLYNTALSGIESAASAFVPGGAALLGVNAAAAKANELSQRGLSTEQSIVGGVASGIFETLFEKVSIGNIKKLQEVDAKTLKDVAFNIAKSMGVNFTEEAATEAANIAYDYFAHGGLSEYEMQIKSLMADGMSEEEAKNKVLKGTLFQVAEAGVSGAIMGAGFGAAGAGTSYIGNRANLANAGTLAKAAEQTGAIINEGQAAPEKSKARKLAESIVKAQNNGKKISDYKLGLLEYENSRQGRVSEGTFAGIGNEADLRNAYEKELLQLDAKTKKSDNKLHQLYNDIQHQKARDSLYEEYKAAKAELEKSGGREGMQEAFEETLKEDVKRRAEAEKLRPEILTADGTQSKLDGSGIFKNAEGVNTVKTEDGKEFKVSELDFKDENTKKLYDATEGMTAEKANLFVSQYNGETVAEYGRAFDYYYRMGRTGMSVENIRKGDNIFSGVLSEEAQAKIATAGLKGREFQKGFTDLSAARKSERYKYESKVLQAVGEKRNLEIFVVDEDSDINGSYLAGTNRIIIRRNAEGRLLLRTAGHEAFHFIKNQVKDEAGKAEVEALEKFVLDALGKNGTDIEAEISRLGSLKDREGNTVYQTREDCIEEIVADSMFDVFTNEKFTRELMNENRSLFGKIANKVKEILADIKSAIRMLGNSDATIRALQDDVDSLEKINSMFDSLLAKAGESYKAENENGQKNNTAGAVKFSIKDMGFEEFDKQTLNNIKMRKGIVLNSIDDLRTHVETALNNPQEKANCYLGAISTSVKDKIENDVGQKLFENKQYSFVISYDDIQHISEHFNTVDKIVREVMRLYEIIKDYDTVKFEFGKSNTKKLIFEKSYSDYDYRSVEIVSKSKSSLDLVTFFVTKNNIKRSQSVPPATQSSLQRGSASTNSIPEIKKSVKKNFGNIDSEYLDFVKNGDTETAQRMVDEAAKAAGYDSPMLYHGTQSFGFTEFDLARMDDKRCIFLTDNPKIASTYSGVEGKREVSKAYGKNIENMSLPELVDELNSFFDKKDIGTLKYNEYKYFDFKKSNELISSINDGIDTLREIVKQKRPSYKSDVKIYYQLSALEKSLESYDYQNLSTPIYMLLHHSDVFSGDENGKKAAELEKNIRLFNQTRFLDISDGLVIKEMLDGYSIDVMNIEEAREELEEVSKAGNYSMYAKSDNALVIDGKGQHWNDIRNWGSAIELKKEDTRVERRDDEYCLVNQKNGEFIEEGSVAVNSFTENMPKDRLHMFMLNTANQMMRIQIEGINTTRDIARFAQEKGYDSVIFKNILDNGGQNFDVKRDETADIYVFFSPSQIKSADPVTYDGEGNVIPLSERFKESEADFRYSKKKTTPIQAHWAEAIRENHYFRNILTLLDEMQSSGGKIQLDGRSIDKIARDIIKSTSSRYSREQLADEITVLYDYMANSRQNADTEEIFSSVLAVAERVLEKSEMKDTELYDQYKNVRDYLRNQPIYITPAVKKEIESQFGDFKTFRNLLFGKAMHITTTDNSAMTLDEVWQELSELAPEYFPKDFNELNMPMQLTAFFEAVAPKVVNPYEHFQENMEDAAAELATEIFQKYYEVGRLQSTQEKYKNLVYENMQKLERNKKAMRQEFKNKVEENRQLNFENYRKRVTEYKQQREAGDRRRKLKNEIDRNYNYLNRRLIRETDNDHIPEALKPLVSAFRFIIPDSNSTFSKARFTEFENEYRKLEEKSSLFDADISERISALCERLTPGIGAPKMRELDLFELEELRNISQHIKFIVQTENRLFSEANKGRVEDFAKAVIEELEGKKNSDIQDVPDFKYRGKWKDRAANKFDALVKGFTKPEYLFASLGSERIKQLYDELRKGENTEAKIIFDAKKAEEEIKAKHQYDPRWETEMITLNMRSGALKVTVEQTMALYATSKRHQGLEHMLGGGVVIYSSEKSKNAKGKEVEKIKRSNRKFTEEDISLLQKSLTTQQKNYVNAMVEYITKDIGRKRNEIALKINGIEKYKETYYFPVKVDRHFVDKSIGRQEVISTIKNQSSAKRTVEHAQNPIEITGFTETVNNHIYDSALYCAYVLPISDFKKVYNFRDKVTFGEGIESLIYRDVSVQDELRRSNGINAIKQIEDFMVALDSGSRYENIIPTSAELMTKGKKVAVMANLSVVIQQPTAVFRAMLYVDPKYFATVASKADIEEMKRWNGCALKKQIGYFDVNMGRTATDFMNEYTPEKSIKNDWSFGDKIRNGNIMLKVDQIAGWGAEKADEVTWGAIWKACKKQTKAENSELSGDALNRAAAELFQTVISKTQVYDSVFTKPDYMRRKEGFAMMTTQFMSEPITSLNMLAEAVINSKKAKGSNQQKQARKFCTRAFACYVTSIIVNNALKGLIYALRDDDEGNSFLEKYVSNVIEGIATEPFGMIPYVKDIMSIVQGYDLERADVAVFTTFIDAFKTLLNSDKGAYEKISAVMKAAGQASGVPFYNVMRDTKAILGISNKISDGIKNGFEPTTGKGVFYQLKECFDIDFIPLIESSSNYEQLYSSIISKDTRHYDKVYNNLIADGKEKSTIESGIAKVLAEKNSTLAEVYTLTAEGKATDAANKINELKAAGFSDNIINKALNTYESNRVKELSEDERTEQAAKARYNRNYEEYERIISELVDEGNKESIVIKAIEKNKLELETKAADYSFDSEDTYDASYDLKNPIISGDDKALKAVYNRYAKEHGEEDARSKIKTQIVNACKDKFISETKAESLLREYVFEEESDVFWQMEEIRTGGKYTKLKSAVDSGAVNRSVIEYYTDNGVEEGTVKQWLTNNYKSKLLSLEKGSAEYNELYDTLIDAYVASGMTEGKAKKKIREWYKD